MLINTFANILRSLTYVVLAAIGATDKIHQITLIKVRRNNFRLANIIPYRIIRGVDAGIFKFFK